MSDESDESGSGTLVRGPWSGDSTYAPPPVPDFADTIPPPEDIPEAPPESPEETTMELPPIPAAPDPAMALRSEGITEPETGEEGSGYEEGEYVQPRSLADHLGDWLEFRLERARARHESEAPFREAEIARKVALLEGRTAQEVAMMEQNGKLHAAMMKAKGDKAAARGKSDADRMKSAGSGMGADKGRSKAGGGGGGGSRGGGGSSGGSGRGTGGGRSSGTQGSGGSGGGNSPKGAGKGSDRSAGGRGGGSKGNESSGGSKGRQSGSGGSGSGKSGSGKGSSGGSGSSGAGKGGSKGDGGSKGGGGTKQQSPAVSPRAERARGRQERAGARQSARHQRRSADQAANLADRSKDRDQARANRQAEWEERRRAKAERKAARKAKREAAKAAEDRTTLGAAVMEGIQDRWDKRRADKKAGPAEDGKDKADKDRTGGGKVEKAAGDGPEGASGAGGDGAASDKPGKKSKAAGGSRERRRKRRRRTGTDRSKRRGRTRRTGRKGRGGTGGAGRRGRTADSPFGAEDATPRYVWPEHPTRPPERPVGNDEDDIVDADIVPDAPAAVTTGVKGLPPAPEKHTQRPGTSRPASTEGSSVSSSHVSRRTGHQGLAAQHRTDITFGEYLVEMANIAIRAASDQERAEALMEALGRVADALREMSADLAGDHNVTTEVTDLIADLADSAGRMKAQAKRCAEQCGLAREAAGVAAKEVARVYGQDMAAKEDAGLKHASAAAHHD